MDDLTTVNPNGRVDVLAYKGAKMLTEMLEGHLGLQGIWNSLEPHIQKVVRDNVTGIDIPVEAKVLLSILQANYSPRKEEGVG